MQKNNLTKPLLATLVACAAVNANAAPQAMTVATFEGLPLAAESYFDPEISTTFQSGGATFDHKFDAFFPGCCWSAFTYSNVTDVTTPGFSVAGNDNDASAYALPGGGGAGGSANYAVGSYSDFLAATPRLEFAAPRRVISAEITNTTYGALSMLNGDDFTDPFTAGDFLLLTITGRDAGNAPTGSIEIALADYRGAAPELVDGWTLFDLSSLGAVSALEFSMIASRAGTPTYFALDNLASVPLPGAALLFAPALALLAGAGRKKNARR